MATGHSAASSRPTLDEILSRHGLEQSDWDKKCTMKYVKTRIFEDLEEWKQFGHHLGLRPTTIEDISRDNHTASECKMRLYWKWVRFHGSKATYRELANALYVHERTDLVEDLAEALSREKVATIEDQVNMPTSSELMT